MPIPDFKVAHIVPVSQLEDTATNYYHMCLAHLADLSSTYRQFYRRMASQGKYVLMDNGAAEGARLNISTLLETYARVNPTEIVIPDVVCDADQTIQDAVHFVDHYGTLPYRFMLVPQGRTVAEWCDCFETLIRMPLIADRIDSIGISKFLVSASGDYNARYTAAKRVQETTRRMDFTPNDISIHLLGCQESVGAIAQIARAVPEIRGCDSAFAYLAAQASLPHIDGTTSRPDGEIDFIGGANYESFVMLSRQFNKHAGVIDHHSGELWSSWSCRYQ